MDSHSVSEKPKLLVLTTTYPRNKSSCDPSFVHELCKRLTDFEVHLIAPHAPGCETEDVIDDVHIHRFRYAPEKLETLAYDGGIAANLKRAPWKYFLLQNFLLSMFLLAYRVARRHQIHLIHAHWIIPTGLIGATLKELLPGKNRLLVTAHGGDILQLRSGIFQRLRRWVAQEADSVSVVSRSLIQNATKEKWPLSNVQVAPMGVDLQRLFTPLPQQDKPPTIVFAGRLVPKKGAQHLIGAMRLVVNQLPDCRLLLAGDGPLREELIARTKHLGLEKQIRLFRPIPTD